MVAHVDPGFAKPGGDEIHPSPRMKPESSLTVGPWLNKPANSIDSSPKSDSDALYIRINPSKMGH